MVPITRIRIYMSRWWGNEFSIVHSVLKIIEEQSMVVGLIGLIPRRQILARNRD